MQHGALVELVAISAPAVEGGIEVGQADLGEKAQQAEVDAEDGRARGREDARDGEQSAVAAQDDDQGKAKGGQFSQVDLPDSWSRMGS